MPKRINASIDTRLEPTIDELLRHVCEGGNAYLSQFSSFDEIDKDAERIRAYLAAVHKGFAAAQAMVFSRIQKLHATSPASRSADERGEEMY